MQQLLLLETPMGTSSKQCEEYRREFLCVGTCLDLESAIRRVSVSGQT